MRAVWLLALIGLTLFCGSFCEEVIKENDEKWVWGEKTNEDKEEKVEDTTPMADIPLTETSSENTTQVEDKEETNFRQGRSRGDGFSEVYNDEPVYRPASSDYETKSNAYDTEPVDVTGKGRLFDGIKEFLGLKKKPNRPHHPHGPPHGGPQHHPHGPPHGGPQHHPHGPPHGGPHQRPHGPPHGGPPHNGPYGSQGNVGHGPFKEPDYKRPQGFIPTDTIPHGTPYGALGGNGHHVPPHRPQTIYRPPKPSVIHRPVHHQRPIHQQRPTSHHQKPALYKPKPYIAKPSPSVVALDPYPTPNIPHKPYGSKPTQTKPYPSAGAIIPHDHFEPECKCVPEYLCRRADTIYHDGAGLIDERSKGDAIKKSKSDDEDTLETASSNKNAKYDDGSVLSARSLETGDDNVTLTGRSISEAYGLNEDDITVQVAVKINKDRNGRILNEGKETGRHYIPGGNKPYGNHNTHQKCQKPLVCCKKPVFDYQPGNGNNLKHPGKGHNVHPSGHHGGVRPQQKHGVCGRRAPFGIHERVKNYEHYEGESQFGDYPWQVAILQQKGPSTSVYACGGVLVGPRHVLTVAHCIRKYYDAHHYNSNLKVRLGEYDVSTNAELYPYQEIYVSKVTIHPYFDPNLKNLHNDLAVVELKHPADVGKPHITPICLPNDSNEFYGRKCFVSGWGKNAFGYEGTYQSRLKQVDLPIVPHRNCEERLRHTRLGSRFKLHHGFICAGGEPGKDACTGDGGSPLVCQDNYGTWQLAGLVSWGIGCGEQHVPGVYVKVSHYHDWLAPLLRY